MSRAVRWIRSANNSNVLPLATPLPPLRMATKRRLRILAMLALFVCCVLLLWHRLFLRIDTHTESEQDGRAENDATGDRRKYGVVIDAGSSGSRLMIYAWDDPNVSPKANGSEKWQLPGIERAGEHWTVKTSPGISSFGDQPRRVGVEHIKPLLDFAHEHIPRHQHARTHVVLLATAGMRLLPRAHQLQILDTACAFARANYDFMLGDCQDSFQVVAGEVEGLFGWIAVNYLLDDGFNNGTHGFLDMGGASAQIAFEPREKGTGGQMRDEPRETEAGGQMRNELARVTLRGIDGTDRAFDVFVATFLGHGTNEARRRYVESLLAGVDGADVPTIDDPCLAPQLLLPTTDGRALLRGQGQFAQCVSATEPLLNKTACLVEPCLFAGVHAPRIDFGAQRFVGVSEYWYASHDYLGLGGMWDLAQFERRAREFCSVPWPEARSRVNDRSDVVAVARVQMQCFKAAWLVNVLHSGFGVPREASPFQSVQQVGETEVSWTLGALLLRVSRQIHPQASPAVVPGIVLPKANASYYDDDDDYDHDHSGDRVDLADDSLWSPVHFAGLRKLLVLWALQPTFVRTLAVFIAILLCFLLVAALYWLLRHKLPHSFIKRSPMFPAPSSPSQLALAESHFTGGGSNEHYMMDVVASSPVGRRGESPEPDFPCDASLDAQSGSIEFRSRSAALANEEVSVSRSSSVSNLALLNRRRGGV